MRNENRRSGKFKDSEVEYLIEPGPGFSVARLLDLEVLVMGGGRERSIDDLKNLLSSAGLAVSKVTPTSRGPAVLECINAQTDL